MNSYHTMYKRIERGLVLGEMAEWLWRQTVNLLNLFYRRFDSFSPQKFKKQNKEHTRKLLYKYKLLA